VPFQKVLRGVSTYSLLGRFSLVSCPRRCPPLAGARERCVSVFLPDIVPGHSPIWGFRESFPSSAFDGDLLSFSRWPDEICLDNFCHFRAPIQ